MKSTPTLDERVAAVVGPRVGTWVEIKGALMTTLGLMVVPRVGTWVEIGRPPTGPRMQASSPAWGRGLKYDNLKVLFRLKCRPPRGDVG